MIVCDGYAGNVLLKSIEGTAMFMGSMMKRMFQKNLLTKLGALCCKSGIDEMMAMLDYREVGGTALLGIRKPVIKAHGSSDPRAFRSAIRQAMEAARQDMTTELEQSLQRLAGLKEMMES